MAFVLSRVPLFLLQQHRHHNRYQRQRPQYHDASLHVQLRTVKETVKGSLVLFGQCSPKRRLSAALIFNELTERRQGLAHPEALRR
jgi:hypothetical protein